MINFYLIILFFIQFKASLQSSSVKELDCNSYQFFFVNDLKHCDNCCGTCDSVYCCQTNRKTIINSDSCVK